MQAWLTTGDRTRLLNQEADLHLLAEHAPSTPAIPTIDVDAGTRYQQMVGFGAAMTDASAYLIMNRMPINDREAVMHDLFGRDSGIGLTFIRVPMGASDFSLRHYSYDDRPAGEHDSTLVHFSIDDDRAEKIFSLHTSAGIGCHAHLAVEVRDLDCAHVKRIHKTEAGS